MRAVLAVGLVAILGVFLLEMSGSGHRTAGSDHVTPAVFAATVPAGGLVCQPVSPLPPDAAGVQLLIGTYGRPVPALLLRLTNGAGATVATGELAAGAHEGDVSIPLRWAMNPHGYGTTVCLRVGGSHAVVIGGDAGPGGSELINGQHQPGNISLLYFRRGSESWWQLLPTLITRFGLGKAAFFGDWTLPVMAVLLLGVWVGTVRLLARALR